MPRPAAARPRRRTARASGRNPLDKLMTGLLGAGLMLLILSKVLGSRPGMAPLASLQRYGWILLLLSAALLVIRLAQRSAKQPSASQTAEVPAASTAPARPRSSPRVQPALVTAAPAPQVPGSTLGSPPPRPTAWGPDVFRVIEWRRFEALVEALFAQAGFLTRSQSHGADGGVDVWLHSKNQPDGAPVSIVQCKHWSSNKPVGVDKIRELRGVMAAHNIRRGQFACTARYTDAAREFAKDNQINLLDGPALLDLIAKRSPEQQQELLDVALEGEYWKPTCVNCGVKMVFRAQRNEGNGFWGCVNYPKCRTTIYAKGK